MQILASQYKRHHHMNPKRQHKQRWDIYQKITNAVFHLFLPTVSHPFRKNLSSQGNDQLIQCRQVSNVSYIAIRPHQNIARLALESIDAVRLAIDIGPARLLLLLIAGKDGVDLGSGLASLEESDLGAVQVAFAGGVGSCAGEEDEVVAARSHEVLEVLLLAVGALEGRLGGAEPAEDGTTESGRGADNGAAAVLDAKLRHELEVIEDARGAAGHPGEDPRQDQVAQEQEDGVLRRGKGEHAVAVAQQVLADAVALLVVRVEKGLGLLVPEHGRQLPAQVDGVLDARVHALAAGGRVNVGRVAGEKEAALAVVAGDAVVQVERGDPARVRRHGFPGKHLVEELLKVLEGQLLFAGLVRPRDNEARVPSLHGENVHDALVHAKVGPVVG